MKKSTKKPTTLPAKTTNTLKHSITEPKKHADWTTSYYDFYQQRRVPICKNLILRLAQELITWARDDNDAITLPSFYLKRGMPKSTFYDLASKHVELAEAKRAAIALIGERREKGALRNKLNTQMVMSQQARFDEDWWTLEKKRADLKARTYQKINSDTRYTVVLDSYKDDTTIVSGLIEKEHTKEKEPDEK